MREPETSCERSDRFGEEVHRVRLPSGLTLWFLPRPGFTRKTAVLAARFGSVHDAFEPADGGPIVRVPAGTAHFLEHRLFETDRGDAFDLFERLGASANAGTGHTNTTYFFSCTDSFYPALEILLSFVDGFRIDDAMVERERRIIVQEILSYADSPDWRGFLGLLGALYPSHPVRLDISGTVASARRGKAGEES